MAGQNNTKSPHNAELLKQGREIVLELKKYDNQNRKIRLKKYLLLLGIILGTLLILLGIIKLFFGTIELQNYKDYDKDKTHTYQVSVNDKIIAVETKLHERTSLIPSFLYKNQYYKNIDYIHGDEQIIYFYNHHVSRFLLDIKSYRCLKNKKQVQCDFSDDKQKWIENKDTKYTHLVIRTQNETKKKLYDGKYKTDISKYIKDKGLYQVEITAQYENIETTLSFRINKLKEAWE